MQRLKQVNSIYIWSCRFKWSATLPNCKAIIASRAHRICILALSLHSNYNFRSRSHQRHSLSALAALAEQTDHAEIRQKSCGDNFKALGGGILKAENHKKFYSRCHKTGYSTFQVDHIQFCRCFTPDKGSFRRGNAWKGVPIVKAFKNALGLYTALRTIFRKKCALLQDFSYTIYNFFGLINQSINQSKHISIAPYVASESEAHNKFNQRVNTSGRPQAPRCLDPDTNFCWSRQRSHCYCFTKRPLFRTLVGKLNNAPPGCLAVTR